MLAFTEALSWHVPRVPCFWPAFVSLDPSPKHDVRSFSGEFLLHGCLVCRCVRRPEVPRITCFSVSAQPLPRKGGGLGWGIGWAHVGGYRAASRSPGSCQKMQQNAEAMDVVHDGLVVGRSQPQLASSRIGTPVRAESLNGQ